MSDEVEDEGDAGLDIFQEPAEFRQPEKEPTFAEHTLRNGRTLRIRLVGFNPLWGHHLWNAGRTLATYLEGNATRLVEGRTILELGAGGGLPSLVAALHKASTVVMTDYPDAELVQNMEYNVRNALQDVSHGNISVKGYLWGSPVHALFPPTMETGDQAGFDTLILGDLLFNHSEHSKLLQTVNQAMKRSAASVALVFFTPYRPWLLDKDLAFFDLARESGLTVKRVFESVMDEVMFQEDPGNELLRRTVYGYELRWPA